jgi:PAS domain S-box-containing protein
VEIIISRGGTAFMIAEAFDVPIVEIQVSPYDILRCLYQLRDYKGLIGIIGFSNVVYGCQSLGNMLGLSIRQIIVDSGEDAQKKIESAMKDGVRMVVGDAISVKQAAKFGLQGMLIVSGKEAIVKAIEEAEKIADVRAYERERSELLRMVISHSHDGIVAIDQNERITIFNPAAEQIFSVRADHAIGANVKDIIADTQLPRVLRDGCSEYGVLQKVHDKVIVTERIAVTVNGQTVAAIANFQDVTELQKLEQIVRQKLNAKGLVAKNTIENLIGQSPAFLQLKSRTKKFAAADTAILICGESGTGKEMLAQSIHNLSRRANRPFVAVNCAALPENLLESELFGYEEGAFTGAKKGGKQGLFELAHGGSIFLDEIGEISLKLQAELLRVIQEREILRVGGDRIIPVDVHLITATNRNLRDLIKKGMFREDLYYRIAILQLMIPPLRERKSDIPLLVDFFLKKHGRLNQQVVSIDNAALQRLEMYCWPGNVRELELVIQRMLVLAEGPIISLAVVDEILAELAAGMSFPDDEKPADRALNLQTMEMHYITSILAAENNNKTRAAKRLGIDRTTLRRKLLNDVKNSATDA